MTDDAASAARLAARRGITMRVRATIHVTDLMMFCDDVTGIEFEIVAPEFSHADNSAVYCNSPEEVLELIRELRSMRFKDQCSDV